MNVITPEIPSERVAIIVFLLCKGRKFTTDEVAELCGVTKRGAYYIMSRISRVLPLTLDNGTWSEFHPEPDEFNGENESGFHTIVLQ